MKKALSVILCFLFVACFLSTNAQVNSLPKTKSISQSTVEMQYRGIEKKPTQAVQVTAKGKTNQTINSKRGKKNNTGTAAREMVISGVAATKKIATLPTVSLKNSALLCDTFGNYTSIDSLTYYSFHYKVGTKTKFGGYISGTNVYKDKASAEFFNINSPGAQLTTAYLLFGKATYASSTNSKVNIKVWDNTGTNGAPGTLLGSQSVKIKDIATDVTNFDFTDVTFTNPITVNTPFYIGVEFSSTAGDTVVLYTTTQYTQNANTGWTQFSSGNWFPYSDADSSWGINLNHYVAAAVCVTSNVNAEFVANKATVTVGETVTFTDLSTGSPTSWSWSFTGAVPYASTLQNPNVTYYTPGTYQVSLTAGDGFSTDTETKTAYITVVASSVPSCDTLHNVDFYNDTVVTYLNSGSGYWSGHNSWGDWGFADYFYGYPSGYELETVMLAFSNAEYSSTTSKVQVKVWDNTGTNGTPGNVLASKNVKIKDIATDVTNGQYTTVTFNSPITITTPFYVGIEVAYKSGDTVALYTNTVYNGKPNTAWIEASDSTWYEFTDLWGWNLSYLINPILCPIQTGSAPVAEFTANATTIYAGDNVNFTDLSTNTPTSWLWTFTGGSPSSSTTQNPTAVVYNTAGTYAVSLTATNSYGSDTETKTAYITVLDTTTTVSTDANFVANVTTIAVGGSVDFTDLTIGGPTSWSWTFTGGSPSSSTTQNPTAVMYNAPGLYTVTLTASGPNGTDTETKTDYINVLTVPTICDTLMNIDPVQDTPIYVSLTPYGMKGYVSGHNEFKDKAKADYFANYTPGAELTGGLFWFGVAKYSSTTSKVTIKVWDNTGVNGTPGAVLASETVTISQIATDIANYEFTDVTFTNSPTINTPFYLGVEFTYKSGDTIALVHNLPGETFPGTAWEQWSTNDWYNYNDTAAPTWGWDVAHYIFPITCYQGTITSVGNITSENKIAVYPNPSYGVFNLSTLFLQSSNIKVSVINTLGEVVYTAKYNDVMAGNFDLDLSNRSAGIYSVKVETDTETYTKQIVISK